MSKRKRTAIKLRSPQAKRTIAYLTRKERPVAIEVRLEMLEHRVALAQVAITRLDAANERWTAFFSRFFP